MDMLPGLQWCKASGRAQRRLLRSPASPVGAADEHRREPAASLIDQGKTNHGQAADRDSMRRNNA